MLCSLEPNEWLSYDNGTLNELKFKFSLEVLRNTIFNQTFFLLTCFGLFNTFCKYHYKSRPV